MQINRITKEDYPKLLQKVTALPPYLDVIGSVPSNANKFLCVVGSRTHSEYGREVTHRLIAGLKGYPIVIVSGLAIGIDSLAHEAALENGLTTIAFPGSGLARASLYPSSRRGLADRIVAGGGALISPFPPENSGIYWTFPARNRLMAATSHATLIIEGRRGSGTLGTADFALGFDRDVLVVPGEIFSELSYGPHMLMSRGATPIQSSLDILETLGYPVIRPKFPGKKKWSKSRWKNVPDWAKQGEYVDVHEENPQSELFPDTPIDISSFSLSPAEESICELLKLEKLSATDLIYKTSISPTAFSISISELEIKNIVTETDGIYRLNR